METLILQPLISRFNSIKVQLEPADVDTCLLLFTEFQFHKGAIRTCL